MGNTVSQSEQQASGSSVEKGEVIFSFKEVPESKFEGQKVTLENVLKRVPKLMKPGDEVLVTNQVERVYTPDNNGLQGTILNAYNGHVPLCLRPDDIWLSITVAFGNFVSKNAEAMRDCFVSHQGKQGLLVKVGPMFDFENPSEWETRFLPVMKEAIAKNTKGEVVDWLTPNFTTTTQLDQTVAQIVLMGTLKEFFSYGMEMGCGLSKVILKGTKTDWENLIVKVRGLKQFNQEVLTKWSELLEDVLNHFVDAYDEKIDEDFWQRICTSSRRGSGGQRAYRGWFLVFYPFNSSGKYILQDRMRVLETHMYAYVPDDSMVDCKISVPVQISGSDSERKVTLVAGSLTGMYDEENNVLRPSVDWAAISNKVLELLDLEDTLNICLADNKSRFTEKQANLCPPLLRYAHTLAVEKEIPNDEWHDLVYEVCNFILQQKEPEETDLQQKFLDFLKRKPFFSPVPFAKYFE